MKKIITTVAIIAFATAAYAQAYQIHFGPNMSQFSGGDYKIGYQVGVTQEWGGRFSAQPGIFLINKGNKSGNTHHLNYLQIPINTKLNFNVGNHARAFLSYGVYGSCGLWTSENTGNFGSKETYRRFDIGGQLGTGFMAGRLGVNLLYQFGARQVYHSSNPARNESIILSITYMLTQPRTYYEKK
jgi:hypothetical protein